MKSRAELLAEIEENRLKNKRLECDIEVLSIAEPETPSGYNPYDHPGQPKEIPDDTDITARRREILQRYR